METTNLGELMVDLLAALVPIICIYFCALIRYINIENPNKDKHYGK